jgi:uncharacterized protein (UPF0548 family)
MLYCIQELESRCLILGSHTIGVVKGEESYEVLRDSFSDLFRTINKIIRAGKVSINNLDIPIEIFLGGDYKVTSQFL